MTHPAAITINDNQQLIACHVQNIRQSLGTLAAANLRDDPQLISRNVPYIIQQLQEIDTLAAQLLGERSKTKDSDQCSQPQASSLPPSSRSPSFADS